MQTNTVVCLDRTSLIGDEPRTKQNTPEIRPIRAEVERDSNTHMIFTVGCLTWTDGAAPQSTDHPLLWEQEEDASEDAHNDNQDLNPALFGFHISFNDAELTNKRRGGLKQIA